jgi:hypothetical protein
MEEVSRSYRVWMDHDTAVKTRVLKIQNRTGASWGIKFELERSWAGKKVPIICFYLFFEAVSNFKTQIGAASGIKCFQPA